MLVLLLTTGCSDDFINLAPFSEANAVDFYKTPQDFENAVNAAYDILQDGRLYGDKFEFLLEVRSDNGQFNDPASDVGVPFDIDKFQVRSDNSMVKGAYDALYDGINRCNIVLGRINNANIDVALAKRLQGEAQFLRGIYYFHLVQLYGNVPLLTKERLPSDIGNVKRDNIADIYAQIETDLKSASDALPVSYSQVNLGRATKGAAMGLLAKVYLTQAKFSLAKLELEKVINLKTYSLLPNITSVFSPSNEMNAEILFAVRYKKGEGGEGHELTFSYTQNPTVSTDLINAYNPLDERLSLVKYVTVSGSLKVPQKYFDVLSTSNNVGNDIIVLRYADIVLMYAEVLNEEGYVASDTSPAFKSLNTIRERAKLQPYTTLDLVNQVAFRAAVLKERRLEFALEFQRWYDLKRTNTVISTFSSLGVTVPECRLIYPIPQVEINIVADPIRFPQNDCY